MGGSRGTALIVLASTLVIVVTALMEVYSAGGNVSLLIVGMFAFLGAAAHPLLTRAWPKQFERLDDVHCFFGLMLFGLAVSYALLYPDLASSSGWVELYMGIFISILAFTGLILRLLPWAGRIRYFAHSSHSPIAGILILLAIYKMYIYLCG